MSCSACRDSADQCLDKVHSACLHSFSVFLVQSSAGLKSFAFTCLSSKYRVQESLVCRRPTIQQIYTTTQREALQLCSCSAVFVCVCKHSFWGYKRVLSTLLQKDAVARSVTVCHLGLSLMLYGSFGNYRVFGWNLLVCCLLHCMVCRRARHIPSKTNFLSSLYKPWA